jgi:hypothetical protein
MTYASDWGNSTDVTRIVAVAPPVVVHTSDDALLLTSGLVRCVAKIESTVGNTLLRVDNKLRQMLKRKVMLPR